MRLKALSDASSVVVDTTSATVDSPGPTFQLGAWMPLGSASCLTGLTSVQIRVCGIDIAVWHKPLPTDAKKDAVATQWSALVDACPHRLAPLSQGRVDPDSGCIECPYHGWAFDTDGTLKTLPQLDEGRTIEGSIASKGAATSLPVHASGDLLFVFLPSDVTGESWPTMDATEEYKPNLLIFPAPIEEGKCRVLMPDFQVKNFPKWLLHLRVNKFLNTDTWLHDVERSARIRDDINQQRGPVAVGAARAGRKATDGLNYMLVSKSDLGPSLFRKWWSKHGFADAPPNTFGPASASRLAVRALNRPEQIDPWNHHAKNCVKCRRALKQMRALQNFFTAGAAVGAISLLQRRPPFAIALVLASMYAYNFLHKLATAIEGNSNRGEIGDRSVAAMK
ncbi:hypothetical protein ACHAXA_006146 [Cyclostephanos tholiformis]|uniref:Rieske domain-containing protein n=1 Tax=Cyclostephanos tholiformis TaxID=382380 RepID=A0ABD3RY76_9STRA